MAITGNDQDNGFRGTIFNDEIFGLGGRDGFNGSPGADTLNGGKDVDVVDYADFQQLVGFFIVSREGDAVDVDLERASQFGGFAEGDVLIDIEDVGGSGKDDIIKGDAKANQLAGNGGNDLLEGRGGDDLLSGDGGFQAFFGVDGNDVLDGGAGNDTLQGDGGNDTLIGGTGLNKLDGGTGTDTASYATGGAGVLVALTLGNGNGVALSLGSTDADQLTSIENIIGSNFADNIAGSSGANVLDGGGGNDLIRGGGGGDTLKGGAGTDTASYSGSAAVNVNLGTLALIPNGQGGFTLTQIGGTGTGGDAQGDTLTGFENLIGSSFADTLTGNNGANRLDGGGGDDIISGGGGNDIIIGGADVDIESLSGGAGFDTFVYLGRSDSNTSAVKTGDFILDFNVDQDLIDLRALGVNAANLLITNNVVDGVHFARVLEDLNQNGQADDNELSINLIVESVADVTLQDILI